MGSTFGGLEIAKRGLAAQQYALNTTGHNIANANTDGYTRQRVNMTASTPFTNPSLVSDLSPGQMGTGVTISSIDRLRQNFLDLQYRTENKNVGESQQKTDILGRIENILNEPSDSGLQASMNSFWDSWQQLSQPSSGSETKEVVKQQGIALAESLNSLSSSLTQFQQDINSTVDEKTKAIDSIGNQIQDLNKQINSLVPHGYSPNDLYDKRDLLIDQLSQLSDIDVQPVMDPDTGKDSGMVKVSIVSSRNGQNMVSSPLVDGTTKYDIKTVQNPSTNLYDVQLNGQNIAFNGGEMKGLLDARGDGTAQNLDQQIIPYYLSRINTLASNLITQVNSVHEQGNGGQGIPFFDGTDASNIKVAQPILDSVDNIAAGTTTASGDNQTALNIFNLKEQTNIAFTNAADGTTMTTSFDGYTRDIISVLGIQSQESQQLQGTKTALVSQIDNQRHSVSGVSIDEEMSNMIMYQNAYGAAARFMTTLDQLYDKLINSTGEVGR
jgi:flagellar hook-associated protein 1